MCSSTTIAPRSDSVSPAWPGQAALGAHADGEDHEVRGDCSVAEVDHHSAGRRRRTPRAGRQDDPHAVVAEVVLEVPGHLGVEHRHHLVERLDQGHLEAAVPQRLDHLQPDVAAADHHRRAGARVERSR